MEEALLARLSALTAEEERLLRGAPLDKMTYSAGPAFVIESAKMIPSGQAITLRPHTRFVDFPTHRHDFVEILYMLRGQTKHTMEDGATITLRPGEILMINCHTAHAIARCEKEDVAVNLMVLPSFFDFALETIGRDSTLGRFLMDALRAGEKHVPYLYFQVAQVRPVQCVMESLLLTLLDRPGGSQLLHKTAMTLLFLHLMDNADRMTLSALHRENALVVSLLQAVHRDYQTLCLGDFARAHGVSQAYLSKAARAATGKSCTELLQARRLKRAQELLANTTLSVLEICSAVGYSNSSHFYRLFEQAFGCSPSAWRKETQVKSGRG